jgi:hypothetical protein
MGIAERSIHVAFNIRRMKKKITGRKRIGNKSIRTEDYSVMDPEDAMTDASDDDDFFLFPKILRTKDLFWIRLKWKNWPVPGKFLTKRPRRESTYLPKNSIDISVGKVKPICLELLLCME